MPVVNPSLRSFVPRTASECIPSNSNFQTEVVCFHDGRCRDENIEISFNLLLLFLLLVHEGHIVQETPIQENAVFIIVCIVSETNPWRREISALLTVSQWSHLP